MCRRWFVVFVITTFVAIVVSYYITMPLSEAVQSIGDSSVDNLMNFKAAGKTAFVVGYTGESGKELVKTLAKTNVFSKVTLIGRRIVDYGEDLQKDFNVEQKVVDFENLDNSADVFQGHDVGFCCLGTTRSKAGVEGFKRVDRDYVLKTAELAKNGGTSHFHLVSSKSANPNSNFLYYQIKQYLELYSTIGPVQTAQGQGEVTEKVKEVGFERFSVYTPGVLLCHREDSRYGEWLAQKVLAPVEYMMPGLLSTPTSTLANAMVNAATAPSSVSFSLFTSKDIHRMTQVKKK